MSNRIVSVEQAHPDSSHELSQALARLRVALDDAYLRASRGLGLTLQQAELLCAAMSPAAVGDLAQTLRCDRSNVSRLVDRASARGLLKRRGGEEDGRVTVVEFTTEGEQLARRFIAAFESEVEAVSAGWSDERQRMAVKLLNDISGALDAARRPARRGWRRSLRRGAGAE